MSMRRSRLSGQSGPRKSRLDDRHWERGTGRRSLFHFDDIDYIADEFIERVGGEDEEQLAGLPQIFTSPLGSPRHSKFHGKDDNQEDTGSKDIKNPNSQAPKEKTAPVEWGDIQAIFTGFNLEVWWRKASMPTRMNAIFVVLLLTFALAHLIVAIILISKFFQQTIRSPYICETKECQEASTWMTSTMNTSKDPCDNFYEFMCDNYRMESHKEGNFLKELLSLPAYKLEFGANSILAKILKNYKNDPAYDQSIEYYQACLNEPKRKEFGLGALVDTVESIFGMRNLTNFESTSLTMEQVGANMLRYCGDASYINIAFYTYPYVAILRPSKNIHSIFVEFQNDNEELIKRMFQNLLPFLGVTDPTQISDTNSGVEILSRVVVLISNNLSTFQIPRKLDNPPQDFIDHAKKTLEGLCPPMGIQLDIRKMLGLFIRDEYRLEFIDLMALKTFIAFETCFAEDPSKFNYIPITYPKLSFVAPWIYAVFWDFLPEMDTKDLMSNWKISPKDLVSNYLVEKTWNEADDHIELRCLLDLSTNLGYLPTIRFLLSTQNDPVEYLDQKRRGLESLFKITGIWFSEIPESEIDPNMYEMGKLIFERGVHTDVLMPLVSGTLDESAAITEGLAFTEDHLRNSYIAIEYTVEKARQNWIGSTNVEPYIRWWALGGPFDLNHELFDIREAYIKAPDFEETYRAANKKLFYKFLGRAHPNYMLFLLTIFDQPYIRETIFLESGGLIFKTIRSIYTLLRDPFYIGRYSSLRPESSSSSTYRKSWKDLIYYGEPSENLPRTCGLLFSHFEIEAFKDRLYTYFFLPKVNTGEYSWTLSVDYLTLLALKQTFQMLQIKREALSNDPLDWNMDPLSKKLRMQRLLPGKILSKYSEEQLMFMAWVRNTCRGSWKTHDHLKENRFILETNVLALLQQMVEFAKVWNCKKESFMNNMGYPRCVRWVPDDRIFITLT